MSSMSCGSGMAAVELRRRGATVAGLDASTALIDVASERTPGGDFRVGDISDLPWGDDEFDVVTSFNGIWGLERPLAGQVRRVLRPGGRFGISFFGSFEHMDIMSSWVIALWECAPPDESGDDLLAISYPGAAEVMVTAAGMTPGERGLTTCAEEFPDVATAARVILSARTRLGRDQSRRRRKVEQSPRRVVRAVPCFIRHRSTHQRMGLAHRLRGDPPTDWPSRHRAHRSAVLQPHWRRSSHPLVSVRVRVLCAAAWRAARHGGRSRVGGARCTSCGPCPCGG